MAALDFHRAEGSNGASFVTRFTTGVVHKIFAWYDARQTERALSKLSAHELEDIGLNKSDLASLTRW